MVSNFKLRIVKKECSGVGSLIPSIDIEYSYQIKRGDQYGVWRKFTVS